MYIWVVLATFILALYSFNLSHRSDMKAIYAEPQAEAIVGKVAMMHEAAGEYLKEHTPIETGLANVNYFQGELTMDDLEYNLPYGFGRDTGVTEVKSLVYCLDSTKEDLSSLAFGCSAQNGSNCCADDNSVNFLVTFGCVPHRWKNLRNSRPKIEIHKALTNLFASGAQIGYTEFLSDDDYESDRNVYGSDLGIRSGNQKIFSIPRFIEKGRIPKEQYSFSDICGYSDEDDDEEVPDYRCDTCLVYMSRLQK